MRIKRWLLLGFAFAAASVQPGRDAQTQGDEPRRSVLVRADGTAWLWTGTDTRPQPIPGVTDATAGGRLGNEALIVRANGAPWTWNAEADSPLARLTSIARVRSIVCNREQCLMVTGDDRLVSWRGGDAVDSLPVLEDVAAVSIGDRHALALSHTGAVWAWSLNDQGQLGSASVSATDEPQRVQDLHAVVSIAAGAFHNVATLQDGSVYAWGAGEAGQLGQPDLKGRSAPTRVPGIERAVQAVASGDHTFVLTEGGEVFSIGGGDAQPRLLKSPGEFARLHAMSSTVLAERSDGRVWDCVAQREVRFEPQGRRASSVLPPAIEGPALAGSAAFLVGPGGLSEGDAFIAKRLEALGLAVEVVHQGKGATVDELAGASVVVVSSSVQAREIDGAALAALAVPIVTWERFLYSPMGLTHDRLPSHGTTIDNRLSIIRPGHPLAGGLDGHIPVLQHPGALTGAEPGPDAQVIAVARHGSASVFAYEAGARTSLGSAPARRVGLFLPSGAEDSLAAPGVVLFDAAIRWTTGSFGESDPSDRGGESPDASGTILLVVNNTGTCTSPSLSAGDAVYKARMEALGFTVQAKQGICAVAADATGKAMVLVSHTAPNGDVAAKFKNVSVPVAIQTAGIVDDMGMVPPDPPPPPPPAPPVRATCVDQLALTYVLAPTHPIANGLSALQTISTSVGFQDWGTPGAAGVKILRCDGDSTHSTGFTYESGVAMPGLNAPARRTMWGFYAPINTSYTQIGKDLFDRMVLWTSNTVNQPPVVNAGPDQAATTCEVLPCTPLTLNGHVFDDGLLTTTYISWSVLSGTGTVTFTNPNDAVTPVTFENTGEHVLQLTADDGWFVRSDVVVIQVYGQGSNDPPIVDAGPNQFVEFPNGTILTGVVTDDGLPNPPGALTYQWTQVSGPGTVVFGTANAISTAGTLPAKGTYVLRLTARDEPTVGLSAYDDVVVTSEKAVLLVVGNPTPPLPAGDAYLKSRFEALGFPVVVRDDSLAVSNDAANRAFVWLSSTTDTDVLSVNNPFVTVTIPVAVQTSGYVDNMRMTSGASGTSGPLAGQSQATITAPAHALAAGLVGQVTTSAPASYHWGNPTALPNPNPHAQTVARAGTDQYAVFAYEKDAPLFFETARERRLFFGFQDAAISGFTADGRRLLDAAIYWLSRTNASPWVDAGPSRTAVLAPTSAIVNLAGYVTDDGRPVPPGAVTTTWSRVSGPGTVQFGSVNQAATTATFTTVGDYILRLTASDGTLPQGGKTASDVTFVSILPAGSNGKPSVSAGPDRTIRLPQKAALLATAADDGLPNPPGLLTYQWTQAAGPPGVSFGSGGLLATTATFPGPGVYVLKITASDSVLSAVDEVQITVEPTLSALFIVQDAGAPSQHDTKARVELEALGFTPALRVPGGYSETEVINAAVIVVSSSIASDALGGVFQSTPKPVVMWESELYDEMGMTAAADNGRELAETKVSIVNPSHPLAGLLSGTQTVYSQPGSMEWGIPGVNAIKVATLVTNSSKAPVFAYESGSTMVSGVVAPARRVGIFGGAAAFYTSSGTALFRAAITWATQRPVNVLLVANALPLSDSDQVVKERIASMGYVVTALTGTDAQSAHAEGKAFVVVSSAPQAGSKFLGSTTAVITWEGSVMSAMKLVGTTPGTSYGTTAGQTKAWIVQQFSPHPLAAGLSGLRTLTSPPTPDTYTWGVPGPGATTIANLEADFGKFPVFGYEIGAPLVPSGNAEDRRVGLFLGTNTGTLLTNDGRALLDAALRWAASSDPDRDGLGTADEYRYGTNPFDADTNDDGVLDGASVAAGISPTSLDVDGDGVLNAAELALGTDPHNRDTDGDGSSDLLDCFPLDPTRWLCPQDVPGPPVITLTEPANAVPLP